MSNDNYAHIKTTFPPVKISPPIVEPHAIPHHITPAHNQMQQISDTQ